MPLENPRLLGREQGTNDFPFIATACDQSGAGCSPRLPFSQGNLLLARAPALTRCCVGAHHLSHGRLRHSHYQPGQRYPLSDQLRPQSQGSSRQQGCSCPAVVSPALHSSQAGQPKHSRPSLLSSAWGCSFYPTGSSSYKGSMDARPTPVCLCSLLNSILFVHLCPKNVACGTHLPT